MAEQGQSSTAFGSRQVAEIVAVYPTAPQAFEEIQNWIDYLQDVINEYRSLADKVIDATCDGRKERHLQFRSYLLQKGVNVSDALFNNFCQWVAFNNELDNTMYWFYEHETYLNLRLEELKDHMATFKIFWEVHAGVSMGTSTLAELGVYSMTICNQSKRMRVIDRVLEYCRARMDWLRRMPEWLYWTEMAIREEEDVLTPTMREMQVSDVL